MDGDSIKPEENPSYLDHVAGSKGTGAVSSMDSISRALGTGFLILKVFMVFLAVVFLFSNIFWVPEGYVAIQSRFGKIVGGAGASVRPPGGPYLALPYPMDRVIRVPTTIQKIALFNAFWSEKDTAEPALDIRPATRGLRPGVHGSLLTADKNLVQGIWTIHYKLDFSREGSQGRSAVTDFVRNVGSMARAGEIIRRLAQAAVVRVVSQTDVSRFVAGKIDNSEIKRLIMRRLSDLSTGLVVTSVSLGKYGAPKSLVPDFEAVTQAESDKALAIEKASRHRVSTLNELAGRGWQALLTTIDAYERALRSGDTSVQEGAFEKAREMTLAGAVGGQIKQTLDEARSDKTAAIQRARASAARFAELLPSYEKDGEMLTRQLVEDAVRRIWSDLSVRAIYVPKGQKTYLDIGRQDLLPE